MIMVGYFLQLLGAVFLSKRILFKTYEELFESGVGYWGYNFNKFREGVYQKIESIIGFILLLFGILLQNLPIEKSKAKTLTFILTLVSFIIIFRLIVFVIDCIAKKLIRKQIAHKYKRLNPDNSDDFSQITEMMLIKRKSKESDKEFQKRVINIWYKYKEKN